MRDFAERYLEKMPEKSANYLTWFVVARRLYDLYCDHMRQVGGVAIGTQQFVPELLAAMPGVEFYKRCGEAQFINCRFRDGVGLAGAGGKARARRYAAG